MEDLALRELMQTVEKIGRNPEEGRVAFGVKTAWKGKSRTESRVDGMSIGGRKLKRSFKFTTDEPLALFGDDKSANPQEYLLGALNACMIIGYATGAAVRGITLTKLEIESTGELDMRGLLGIDESNPGYEKVRSVVRIDGDGTPEQYREIHETVLRTSPAFCSVVKPIHVDSELIVG